MKYLLGLLWLVLTGVYFYAWQTARATCCNPVTTVLPVPAQSQGPLVFKWGSSAAITNDLFPAYRDSIVAALGPNDKFEITGLYSKDEENTSNFENMGLARANEVKKLFLAKLPEDRIVLRSALREDVPNHEELFPSAKFRGLKNTKSLVEIDDKTIIYFPLNSTSKLNSAEVEDYLKNVAKRVKESGETVALTGHTCDRGTESNNLKLGRRRAGVIRDYLIQLGVPDSQIVVDSKGEAEPMVPNTNEENRAKNRRTVLRIVKK